MFMIIHPIPTTRIPIITITHIIMQIIWIIIIDGTKIFQRIAYQIATAIILKLIDLISDLFALFHTICVASYCL